MKTPHAVLLLVTLTVACGGNHANGNLGPSPVATAFEPSPQSLSVVQGGSASSTITITRAAADINQAIGLSVSGAPSGITATFDQTSTTADTVTLMLTAAACATVGDATLTISAVTPSVTATVAVALTVTAKAVPASIDLAAHVLTGEAWIAPSVAVTVWSGDCSPPRTTTAGIDGTFAIAGIVAPYDVLIQRGDDNALFLAAHSATPTFTLYTDTGDSDLNTVTFNPTITGGTPSGEFTTSAFQCDRGFGAGFSSVLAEGVFVAADTQSQSCTFHLLEVTLSEDLTTPVGYGGYGEASFDFTQGAPSPSLAIDLGTPPLSTRSVSYTFAPAVTGYTVLHTYFGTHASNLASQAPTIGSGTLVIPTDSRIAMSVSFQTLPNIQIIKTLTSDITSFTIDALPTGSELTSPSDGAMVNDGTTFSFSGVAESVQIVQLAGSDQSTSLQVITRTPFTGADLRARGVPLAATTFYSAQITTVGPADVDTDFSYTRQIHIDGYHADGTEISFTTE